jgi:exopolysaccharide production protein ExoZ
VALQLVLQRIQGIQRRNQISASAGITPGSNTVLPIQYLRGIAAVMVVWHHTKIQIPSFEKLLPGTFGASGVDIFFVISGFIMLITTARSPIGPGEFMVRRLLRVVPLYWLLTIAMVMLWLAAPGLFKTLVVSPLTLLQSLFLIPHFSQAFPTDIFPLLVPGWTLNFEMFFYVLFAAALFLPRDIAPLMLCSFMVVLVGIGMLLGPFASAPLVTYTSPLLLEFVAGVLIGQCWMRHPQGFSAVTGWVIFAFGWSLLAGNHLFGGSHYITIASACLIVAGALNSSFLAFKNQGLKVLGDATYAIYLSHIFSLGVMRFLWTRWVGIDATHLNAIAFATIALAGSLLVGVAIYFWMERPLGRFLNGVFNARLVALKN